MVPKSTLEGTSFQKEEEWMMVQPGPEACLENIKERRSLRMKSLCTLVILLILSVGAVFLAGCVTTGGEMAVGWGSPQERHHQARPVKRHGPPAHAPAYGYRAKHAYWYYPDSYVYFDTYRGVYFYLEDDNWRVSVSLPRYLQVSLGDHVTIEMDTDKPYTQFDYDRKKFPPGHMKKDRHWKKKGKKW